MLEGITIAGVVATPINIAAALIDLEVGDCSNEKMRMAGVDNLEEIADHLRAYIRRQRRTHELF